jgi:DNA processing protein
MALSADERDLLALHLVPGIGPRLCAALLERFGSAAAALRASEQELREVPHIGAKIASQLKQALARPDLEEECRLLEQYGVHVLFHGRPDYPVALAMMPLPPHLLYVKGTLPADEQRHIAIVGSRACTSYGRRIAERLAHDLARAGWTIVSGLARGIDGEAHRGALRAKGRTIAVLAGGLSRIYPPEHKELAEQVAASGALVSEASMRMEPMAGMFPVRNRIISGLCRGVIIVEANEKSGALITARLAGEQGREVFAVPGPVDSAASAGSLTLLRNGAKLVRSADDVLEDLQALPSLFGAAPPPAADQPAGLDEVQQRVWQYLDEKRTADEITRHLQLPSGEVTRQLMTLELRKVVRRLPGNWYERV